MQHILLAMKTKSLIRHWCVVVLLLVFSFTARAQITEFAEYYWDNNPGSAVGMSLTSGGFNATFIEAITQSSASLSQGTHSLHVRVRGADGTWSTPFVTMISVDPATPVRSTSVSLARYYFDNNEGSAVNMVAFNGNFTKAYEQATATNANALSAGVHSLHVQVLGADGSWSTPFTTMFSVAELAQARPVEISLARYYFDNNGGSAINMVAFNGNFTKAYEQATATNANALSQGVHSLHVQVQGADGSWSTPFTTMISVSAPAQARSVEISMARYYFDNNEGSAVNMVAFNGNFTKAYEQATASNANALSAGVHSLHVQVLGADGAWSTPFTTMISVMELAQARSVEISLARYYFDNNEGSAINMIAFNGNFTKAYEQATATNANALIAGVHSLHVQVLGADGAWSTPFTTMISVAEQAVARSIRIQLAEMFFDVDPGEGNATALVAFDGSFNTAFEAAFGTVNSAVLDTGQHSINVRFLGEDGVWSNIFRTMIYIDPCHQ
jgi:methionine-rich copper-binding protein CopC